MCVPPATGSGTRKPRLGTFVCSIRSSWPCLSLRGPCRHYKSPSTLEELRARRFVNWRERID
jgi:hypothetical protein